MSASPAAGADARVDVLYEARVHGAERWVDVPDGQGGNDLVKALQNEGWEPSQAEHDLLTAQIRRISEIHDRVYRVEFTDGTEGIFKPHADVVGLDVRLGARAASEIGAFRVSDALGLDNVPTTVPWHGLGTVGSMQRWVDDARPALPVDQYDLLEQERLAVLDYVIATGDRTEYNYVTTPEGRPFGVDNAQAFRANTPGRLIKSDFVRAILDRLPEKRALDADLVARLRSLDLDTFRRQLLSAGLPARRVDGAIERLVEIRTRGTITGEAWMGSIVDGARW